MKFCMNRAKLASLLYSLVSLKLSLTDTEAVNEEIIKWSADISG